MKTKFNSISKSIFQTHADGKEPETEEKKDTAYTRRGQPQKKSMVKHTILHTTFTDNEVQLTCIFKGDTHTKVTVDHYRKEKNKTLHSKMTTTKQCTR